MDPREQELVTKVGAMVAAKYGGSYRMAFDYHDDNGDGRISVGELIDLLKLADVGYRLTRAAWAAAIIDRLDTDGDDLIAWPEFEAVFTGT